MNNRSNLRDAFYSLAMFIIFSLLFTSCASEVSLMYKPQMKAEVEYDQWDLNSDDVINEKEFYKGIYQSLNINNDAYLNKNEWSESNYFFSTYYSKDYGNFKKWDFNNDTLLSTNEFIECFSSSKLFTAWDEDQNGKLDDSELSNGLFDTWDINNDATLSSFEAENWLESS